MADLSAFNDKVLYPYIGCEVVDISTTDHVFTKAPARGLIVTASGDVSMLMVNGSTCTIPVVVDSSSFVEIRGFLCNKVLRATTSATVKYGMY